MKRQTTNINGDKQWNTTNKTIDINKQTNKQNNEETNKQTDKQIIKQQ